jgi:hypothetical protein
MNNSQLKAAVRLLGESATVANLAKLMKIVKA